MPVVYKKNYVPGTNTMLNFDGYYSESRENQLKPVFFYRDGSVWFAETFTVYSLAQIELNKNDPSIAHSWGNYKIEADTIYVERFHLSENTNNYRRIILKGVLQVNAIRWIQREENRQNPVKVDYYSTFTAHSPKPDSSGNWTRTREQYNK